MLSYVGSELHGWNINGIDKDDDIRKQYVCGKLHLNECEAHDF